MLPHKTDVDVLLTKAPISIPVVMYIPEVSSSSPAHQSMKERWKREKGGGFK